MTVMTLNKLREKMIRRIVEIEKEHFIPVHREKKEFFEKKNDEDLQRYLRAMEIMHIEWAVGDKKVDIN